jgi:hypothetical protein
MNDISIKTTCAECGTPLWGINLNKRGTEYYCSADYQRLSPEEKLVNDRTAQDYENYQKMFDGTAIEEYVTNGGFDSNASWTTGTGWTISGGVASSDGSQSAESLLTQVQVRGIADTYTFTYTISGYSAGSISVRYGTNYTGTARSANGTYTEDLFQSFEYNNNALAANTTFVGSVDNFSIRRKKT